MAEEWFRTVRWDATGRADFERRLARARPSNRPQYLRIKAFTLAGAGRTDDARELFARLVRDHPDAFVDVVPAVEALGDLCRAAGDPVGAEAHYRDVLRRSPSLNATSTMVGVRLAALLVDRGELGEAADLLEARLRAGGMLDVHRFEWFVVLARLQDRGGATGGRRRSARAALDLVDRPPALPRHPTVGRVLPDPATLTWLRAAAT
jgi:predicted Zn-dependent protease